VWPVACNARRGVDVKAAVDAVSEVAEALAAHTAEGGKGDEDGSVCPPHSARSYVSLILL
jgi:hypothetical protein